MENYNMKYTVQLDFSIDEDAVRTDEEVKEVVEEIFDYGNCSASNIKVIDTNWTHVQFEKGEIIIERVYTILWCKWSTFQGIYY